MKKFIQNLALGLAALLCVATSSAHAASNPALIPSVDSIATLEALKGPSQYPVVNVVGYYAGSTVGGGQVKYSTTGTVDGCTVFAASDGKYWVRQQGTSLSVDECGAKADGATNDAAAFTSAFAVSNSVTCTAGKTYLIGTTVPITLANTRFYATGCKIAPQSLPATAIFSIRADGFTGYGIYILGGQPPGSGSGGGIAIGDAGTTVNNIVLNDTTCSAPGSGGSSWIDQCVWSWDVNNLRINGITLLSVGYGVLEESGHSGDNVSINNLYASDIYADAIDENSVTAGKSSNWDIGNFVFKGSHGYPSTSLGADQSFAAFTAATGINIHDGSVKNSNGDCAIHLETTANTIVISNVVFTDNLVQSSYDGNICPSSGSNGVTTHGDKFVYTTAQTGHAAYLLSTTAGASNAKMSLNNDEVNDLVGGAVGAYDLDGHQGVATITGSVGYGCGTFIQGGDSIQYLTVTGTHTYGCVNGYVETAGSSGILFGSFVGNVWQCSGYCFQSAGPVAGPNLLTLKDNTFSCVGATCSGVDAVGSKNSFATGNLYGSGMTYTSILRSPSTSNVECLDALQGTGILHACGIVP